MCGLSGESGTNFKEFTPHGKIVEEKVKTKIIEKITEKELIIYTTNNKISCLGFIILHTKIFS